MVFGIGEGKIDIITEKQSYANGEMLKGKVMLNLNSAKKAKGLRIQFYGERTERKTHFSGGRSHSSSSTERIMAQEIKLDVEKEYPAGSKDYDFSFQLPTLQKPGSGGDGIFGAIAGIFSSMTDPYANVQWFLDSSLDLPMSFDISKKQRVNFIR